MGPCVPAPKFFDDLWGPRESDLSDSWHEEIHFSLQSVFMDVRFELTTNDPWSCRRRHLWGDRVETQPLAGLPIMLVLGDYSLWASEDVEERSSFIIPRVVMASYDVGLSPVSFHDYPEHKTPSQRYENRPMTYFWGNYQGRAFTSIWKPHRTALTVKFTISENRTEPHHRILNSTEPHHRTLNSTEPHHK